MTMTPTHEGLEQKVSDLERQVVQHKIANAGLQETERQLAGIVASVPDKISLMDDQYNIVWSNPYANDFFGQDLVGTKCYISVYGYDRPCIPCVAQQCLEDGLAREHRMSLMASDGRPVVFFCVLSVAARHQDGRPKWVAKIARDVTDQERVEEQLRIKDCAIASSISPIAFADLDGDLTYVNDSFLRMWGYARENILGKPAVQFWDSKGRANGVIDAVRVKGSWVGELTATRKDNSLMEVQLVASMVMGEDNKPMCMMGSFVDVTERKQAERDLRLRELALEVKTKELEELNSALRVLLQRRYDDKAEIEKKVLFNVNELVMPYIQKMKKTHLDASQAACLGALESNVNEIVSPFAQKLSLKYQSLTPTEIKIAHLVREGRGTKEIGRLMSQSNRTVETHRRNIRTKIGIKNRKANLRSHLLTFQNAKSLPVRGHK